MRELGISLNEMMLAWLERVKVEIQAEISSRKSRSSGDTIDRENVKAVATTGGTT